MKIYGKEIADECARCGKVLECELFKTGHGIKCDRANIAEMVECQIAHANKYPQEEKQESDGGKMPEETKEIYTGIWQIHKNFCNRMNSDDDCDELRKTLSRFIKVHDSQFAKDLAQAVMLELTAGL